MLPIQSSPGLTLAAAHALLASSCGTAVEDKAHDALLATEDVILGLPQDTAATVILRGQIAARRLRVVAEDDCPDDLNILDGVISSAEEALREATGGVAALVAIARQHLAAILAGSSADRTLANLDPDRQAEAEAITAAISWGDAWITSGFPGEDTALPELSVAPVAPSLITPVCPTRASGRHQAGHAE